MLFGGSLLHQTAQPSNAGDLFVDNDGALLPQQSLQHLPIEGLEEPGIDQPHFDAVMGQQRPGLFRFRYKVSVGDHRNILSRIQPLPTAERQRFQQDLPFRNGIFGIPQQKGTFCGKAGRQQAGRFGYILPLRQYNPRDRQQQRNIVNALMRNAVFPDDSAAVDADHHRALHPGDIVIDLIIAPLQKGGIDGHKRAHPRQRQRIGQHQRVLLGNSSVNKAFRVAPAEFSQMGAGGHGRGNGIDPFIPFRQLQHCRTDRPPLRGAAALNPQPALGIKGTHAVPQSIRIIPAKIAAVSLFGHDMQQHRAVGLLCHPQKGVQLLQIMPIHRPVIGNAHFLKQGAVTQIQPLQILFDMLDAMHQRIPHHGDLSQRRLGPAFGAAVAAVQPDALQ